ncbi:hypothetical protein QCA50_017790 [Cerrena zonata]|uniref:Uncharacterized protein n=1 Tax=Cerrena zonata TaxID=2478898 RepID=A0AAW0FPJ4_9APHY
MTLTPVDPAKYISTPCDREKTLQLISQVHSYSVSDYSTPPLSTNASTQGTHFIADMDKYSVVRDQETIITMVPQRLGTSISIVLEWLSEVSYCFRERKTLKSASHVGHVLDHYSILHDAVMTSLRAAESMWALGIMHESWVPWKLAMVLTYWNVFGFLEPSIWSQYIGGSVESWLKISYPPREGGMFSLALNLFKPGATNEEKREVVITYFGLYQEIEQKGFDVRKEITLPLSENIKTTLDSMCKLRIDSLCQRPSDDARLKMATDFARLCLKIAKARYLTIDKQKDVPMEDNTREHASATSVVPVAPVEETSTKEYTVLANDAMCVNTPQEGDNTHTSSSASGMDEEMMHVDPPTSYERTELSPASPIPSIRHTPLSTSEEPKTIPTKRQRSSLSLGNEVEGQSQDSTELLSQSGAKKPVPSGWASLVKFCGSGNRCRYQTQPAEKQTTCTMCGSTCSLISLMGVVEVCGLWIGR